MISESLGAVVVIVIRRKEKRVKNETFIYIVSVTRALDHVTALSLWTILSSP